jgi:hypothetical protein
MKINTACWVNGCKCFNPNDEDGVWIKKDRDWVGLTDAERELAAWSSSDFLKMAESIEAKLREKNG